MESEWMGRYRPLVAALVRHGNVCMSAAGRRKEIGEGIELSSLEWQVLECIVERRYEATNMIAISNSIGVPQSTFSKTTKKLCDMGLVEKYQAVNNRKNIILRPTDTALELYKSNSARLQNNVFGAFFDKLTEVRDEDINAVAAAVQALNDALDPPKTPEDIRLLRKE